ncbi:MAG TPA: 23S rRNA (adenine(2503)-C(2))-methyltransferase RlmN [Bacilli bacterium]|nr:23S rRNA (adenine(2503)-C(2))-methyltransferase RlmN [Bacilli bacterium]
MKNIYNYSLKDLENIFIEMGESKYRASQVFEWLYIKRVKAFNEMTNLKKELIDILSNMFSFNTLDIAKIQKDKGVKKYLFNLNDNNKIEAVLMEHDYGTSLCISTQVGCNMGCLFCESGRLKKNRNLETYEMVNQILNVEEDTRSRISHIVIMGIGEPFDNYDSVLKFIEIVNNPKGINIGARHITISTCGLVPKIDIFASEKLGVNLAISLHASSNNIRDYLMPINKVYNIEKIINSVKNYINKTSRRVTFEYILIKDINDKKTDALNLVDLLKGINCYVNIIPYNETSNNEFKKSDKVTTLNFYDILKNNNINVTIRKEFGSKVSAACGQLRSESR